MMNENKSEMNEKKDDIEEIKEAKLEKVAGGVPIIHPGHHYKDPEDEPYSGDEHGYLGTW